MILCDSCNKWFHWYDNPIQLRIANLYHIVYSFKRACVDVNSEPVEEQWNCIDCKDKIYNEMDKDMWLLSYINFYFCMFSYIIMLLYNIYLVNYVVS